MTAQTSTRPGRPGGEKRGNNIDRANRKVWMLFQFGNGEYCRCVHCGTTLTFETVEADRIIPGGSYRHENVQPACRSCNLARSNDITWTLKIEITVPEQSPADAALAFQATVAALDMLPLTFDATRITLAML